MTVLLDAQADSASQGRKARWGAALVLAGLAGALLLGCQQQDEEIRSYKAPKDPAVPLAALRPERPATRLLAAIFPQKEHTWFFKLVGPSATVADYKEAFEQFIDSVRFTDRADEPITWTLPGGWQRKPGSKDRYATLVVAGKGPPLELTVVPLGAAAGSLLDNVNRWRGQLGLKAMVPDELTKCATERKVNGVAVTLVDIATPGKSSNGPAADQNPTYTVPEGWQKNPNPDRMHRAAFLIRDGNEQATATLTPLQGPAGGLLANVNRWRDEVKLGRITEEQLNKELRTIEVDGAAAPYVDLSGPEAQGASRQRTLGVVIARGPLTWFVKLRGPATLVGKQQPAFEAFVKSLRFNGDPGAKHE